MKDTIHFQLLAAHTLFQKTFLSEIKKYYPHLLPGQPKIIDYLIRKESAYQTQIARACLLEPPTLSVILNKMEDSGLICREKKADNKKNIVVSLTDTGKEIGERIVSCFVDIEKSLCAGLNSQEIALLSKSLNTIYANALEYNNEI